MSMIDRNSPHPEKADYPNNVEPKHWSVQLFHWINLRFAPALGWGSMAFVLLLLFCFAFTLEQSRWLRSQPVLATITMIGLVGMLLGWWLYGWGQDRRLSRVGMIRVTFSILLFAASGLLLVSEMIAGWLPGFGEIVLAARTGAWNDLSVQIVQNLERLNGRLLLWWQIVQANEPVRDDLVLALFAALMMWLLAGVTVVLLRRTNVGLLAGLPVVASSIALTYWGRETRSAVVLTLAVSLLLHLWLHHRTLQARWDRLQLDYSTSLVIDRMIAALGAGVLVILLASILPNLYIRPLAIWYWQLMSPANQRLNEFRQQILPDFVSSTRWRSGGIGSGGLPNEFMLGAGPQELGNMLVMYVRTNEGGSGYEQEPPGFYMRALTLSQYDGKGWRNPSERELQSLPANQRWIGGEKSGRRLLLQSVDVQIDSPMLFAAGEPVEASVDSEVEWLPNGDLIGFRSWERRYTMVSSVPAVGELSLIDAGDWGSDQRLPTGARAYLALPASVPGRVKELAAQLTITATSLYEKSALLEGYLRQFPYDLTVPEPPAEISDVADYFLFDLQRGYCDYYATAFVVLARSLGIPARMATGYAVGSWNFSEFQWAITEAQAHSWPEVFFPQYGWIPFEPTAGRPTLVRVDLSNRTLQPAAAAQQTTASLDEENPRLSWQSLIWLLPILLLIWGMVAGVRAVVYARRDPWQSLLRWGAKRGHPMAGGETILEYGYTLSTLFANQANLAARNDGLRAASREVAEMSEAVSELRYATEDRTPGALAEIDRHWQRVKGVVR